MNAANMQDAIDSAHGVAFFEYSSADSAKEFVIKAESFGFCACCHWSPSTDGIVLGSWYVHVWRKA